MEVHEHIECQERNTAIPAVMIIPVKNNNKEPFKEMKNMYIRFTGLTQPFYRTNNWSSGECVLYVIRHTW